MVRRRGIALALIALASGGATLALTRPWSSKTAVIHHRQEVVRLVAGGQPIGELPTGQLARPAAQAQWLATVPPRRVVQQGRAQITLRTDTQALAGAVARAQRAGGGVVSVPQTPVAVRIALPVIQQQQQNNCEASALSIVLRDRGVQVGQLALQRQVAHAQPIAPQPASGGRPEIWGDPALGFVGQGDGLGYGVYQGPIAALAQRHGVTLSDLSRQSPQQIYSALLAGHPVMAWIALSAGPYQTWQTPGGRLIRVNFGEHAVVLTGIRGSQLTVNNPLSGQRETWSKADFEHKWAGLGRRALET